MAIKIIVLLLSISMFQSCAVIWMSPKNTECEPLISITAEQAKDGEKK